MNKQLMILLAIMSFFSTSFADTNGIWTYAEDIVGGEFGADENSTNFTFSDVVYFNQDLVYKSTKIEELFVNRSGDSMNGNLDMNNNNVINVNRYLGTEIILSSSGNSSMGGVFAEAYYTRGEGNSYYLRPANTSVINNLEVDGSIIDDLDLGGNSLQNINRVEANEICDENGNNCFNPENQGSGFSSNIVKDALVVSSRGNGWNRGPSSRWGYSFDSGSNDITSSETYEVCFLTTTLFPTKDDQYTKGTGCALKENPSGNWTLSAFPDKRASAYCAATCFK